MNYQYEKVDISSIQLDRENPRFPPVSTEREAIKAMLEEQGEKLFVLATDIARYGLDPSKRLILFREKNKYVDGDGNRRITALKILETPELIQKHRLYSKFKKLSKSRTVEVDSVECVVFKSREVIKHWLEINHGGFLEGRGQIPWSSEQKDRFEGGKSTGLLAKEILLEQNLITIDEFDAVNVTTLSRLLNSKPGKTALSIKKDNGHVNFNDMSGLKTIFNDLKGKSVKEVYHDSDRKEFLMRSLGSLEPATREAPSENGGINAEIKKGIGRRTQRVQKGACPIFGEKLILQPGHVNNIYRDICDIYEMSKGSTRCVEILGFSLRLILDVAAHEYFKEHPKDGQVKDNVYRDYLRVIKKETTGRKKNSLAIDKAIKNLVEEKNVEALLAKLAHGTIQSSMETVLNLSFIVGPILKIHFSKGDE